MMENHVNVRNLSLPSKREPNPKCHKQRGNEKPDRKYKPIRGTGDATTIMHCIGSTPEPRFPQLSSIFQAYFSHNGEVAIVTPV